MGIEQYQLLQREWQGLCSTEPVAWAQQRSQHIELLKRGHLEEFFLLVSENPPLFASLFALEQGFLRFAEDVLRNKEVERGFCFRLLYLEETSPALSVLWKEGLFDRLLFALFGDVEDCSDAEKKVLCRASMRSALIPSGTFVMGALERGGDAREDVRALDAAGAQAFLASS